MNEASKLIINPVPKEHKVKRGDCGTCNWFERVPEQPKGGNPWAGWCLHNPPMFSQVFVETGIGPPKAQAQGVVPPTFETRRCHHWRPAGTNPPFDDAPLQRIPALGVPVGGGAGNFTEPRKGSSGGGQS